MIGDQKIEKLTECVDRDDDDVKGIITIVIIMPA